MKYPFSAVCVSAMLTAACPAAHAGNAAVEEALSQRSEFSSFYKALQDTGVLGELQEGMSYTVLAPTNAAFAAQQRRVFPCFNPQQCKDDVADILRAHIVPGIAYIGYGGAGKNALFSISQRHIPIGHPTHSIYTVDGQRVLDATKLDGGMIYAIDGVIVPKYARLDPTGEEQRKTVVSREAIYDPACGPEGCPRSLSETTTISRPITDVEPAAGDEQEEE